MNPFQDGSGKHFYEFGPFSVNMAQRVLLNEGEPVPLGEKAFQTLLALVENRGRVVAREDLVNLVWPGSPSRNDNNLNQQIRNVRKALGDDARAPAFKYVRTIPGEGYRFVADVTERWEDVTAPLPQEPIEAPTPQVSSAPGDSTSRRRGLLVAAATVILAGLVTCWPMQRSSWPLPSLPAHIGRVLVRSTSEGRHPTRIKLSHPVRSIALNPDGGTLFATSDRPDAHTLSILNTVSQTVRMVTLPAAPRGLAVSPGGKLYIGSQVEGIMVFDIARDRLLPGLIPTGGPVWDMAITPDGKKLFIAMSHFGVKRLLIGNGDLKQITDQQCPKHLELDPSGHRLYVSYQCGGPAGRAGHDSLEIFDADKENTIGVFSGPPLVGGPVSVAPDGGLLTLDGLDACRSPAYDRVDCPIMPVEGEIFYLFRPEDRRVLRTFAAQSAPLTFVDASRFLVTGQASLTVVDATSGAIREKLDGLGDSFSKALRASDGRRVFIGEDNSPSLLILEPEDRSCSPPLAGLAQFYSGDGTFEDTASVTELTPQGNVSFVPGKIGQAFYLDGNASLDGPRTADYAFGVQDSTLALYVKLGVGNREMTIMDRRMTSWAGVFALRTSGDNRFLFEAATPTGPLTLVGKNPAIEDHWYHLAVTLAGREFSLYIDGELQHQLSLTSLTSFVTEGRDTIGRLHFGAGNGGRAPFNGWLDEITFYNRALSREEIKKLYESREYGPCAMTGKSQ